MQEICRWPPAETWQYISHRFYLVCLFTFWQQSGGMLLDWDWALHPWFHRATPATATHCTFSGLFVPCSMAQLCRMAWEASVRILCGQVINFYWIQRGCESILYHSSLLDRRLLFLKCFYQWTPTQHSPWQRTPVFPLAENLSKYSLYWWDLPTRNGASKKYRPQSGGTGHPLGPELTFSRHIYSFPIVHKILAIRSRHVIFAGKKIGAHFQTCFWMVSDFRTFGSRDQISGSTPSPEYIGSSTDFHATHRFFASFIWGMQITNSFWQVLTR